MPRSDASCQVKMLKGLTVWNSGDDGKEGKGVEKRYYRGSYDSRWETGRWVW